MKKSAAVFSGIMIAAVILVVIHTAVEELAIVMRLSWEQRMLLLAVGLGLDILFTLDFVVRSYFALLHRRMGRYFFRERGWMDFLASIPLLVLTSGPAFLAAAAGTATVAGLGGVARVIEITKAIRTGRVLRLMRLHKLSPLPREQEGSAASRAGAPAAIAALAVVALIAGLLPIWFETGSLEERVEQRYATIARYVDEGNLTQPGGRDMLASLVAIESDLLIVQDGERRVYSRHSAEYYQRQLGPHDYLYLESGEVGVYFDIRGIHAAAAHANLTYLAIALAIVLFARARRR